SKGRRPKLDEIPIPAVYGPGHLSCNLHEWLRANRAIRTLKPKVLALAIECAGIDAQDPGGVVERQRFVQDQPDVLGLELIETHPLADLNRRRIRGRWVDSGRSDSAWQIAEPDGSSDAEDDRALDRIAQLAKVSRPGVLEHRLTRFGRESLDPLAQL